MVDTSEYREAMSRLGAAVNLITTNGVAGRRGFTASAVCSVTDTANAAGLRQSQLAHEQPVEGKWGAGR